MSRSSMARSKRARRRSRRSIRRTRMVSSARVERRLVVQQAYDQPERDVEFAHRPQGAGQRRADPCAGAAARGARRRAPAALHAAGAWRRARGARPAASPVTTPGQASANPRAAAIHGSGRRWGRHGRMPILTQRFFHTMRLAAIDIGTNSVHMIVVQVRPDLSFEVIDREKEMVRLGAGGLDGRKLTDTAMDAALQALSKFRRLADSHHVDEILAAATSATREAENGAEFLGEHHRSHRHPASRHLGQRRGAADSSGRRLRGRRQARQGRGHRHRRWQRRDHLRRREAAARPGASRSASSG